jgi:transposase-like protein
MRKRRQFTPEFKARVVLDVRTGVQSQAEGDELE